MFAVRIPQRRLLAAAAWLLTLSLITGCGGGTPAPAPTQASSPAPKPPPVVTLNVNPAPQVQVGQSVAIVAKVEPFEKLDLKWSVSGTSGGKLNTDTGGQVVYTSGDAGVDIVVAEGTTASGVPVQQTVALTVVAAPNTPTPPPPPVTASSATPTMAPPPAPGVTLTNIQEGQPVLCSTIARGTYPLDLKEDIWPVVYINNRYHPQDQGGTAARKESGSWYQTVRFGDCNQSQKDVGKPFELIIVTANESANAQFEEYIRTGAAKGWPGFESLPPGTQEKVHIMVIRQ